MGFYEETIKKLEYPRKHIPIQFQRNIQYKKSFDIKYESYESVTTASWKFPDGNVIEERLFPIKPPYDISYIDRIIVDYKGYIFRAEKQYTDAWVQTQENLIPSHIIDYEVSLRKSAIDQLEESLVFSHASYRGSPEEDVDPALILVELVYLIVSASGLTKEILPYIYDNEKVYYIIAKWLSHYNNMWTITDLKYQNLRQEYLDKFLEHHDNWKIDNFKDYIKEDSE